MGEALLTTRRRLLGQGAGALAALALLSFPRAARAASGRDVPLERAAEAALGSLPDKAILGASGAPILVTEFVDFNAPDWRRSALDMRALLASDPKLAYALVQAPRFDVRSLEAARVALAVLSAKPALFEPFYMALAESSGTVDGPVALAAAAPLGFDRITLFNGSITADVTTGLSKAAALASMIGLLDTPAYVIGNMVHEGYLDLDRKRALIAAVRS